MAETLRRPELYVPLSVRFLTGDTGTRLLERFGRDGPLVWAAYLAACKLNRPEGEIVYASEAEGWALLGLDGHEPDFTLADFFAFTGRIKKTRRTRIGRIVKTQNTAWTRWSKAIQREDERQRKSRKRAQASPDKNRTPPRTESGQTPDLEPEPEREEELTTSNRSAVPQHGSNGSLDTQTELELANLLAWVGDDADTRTAAVLRHNWEAAPEAARLEVNASIRTAQPRHRARWLIGTIKAATERSVSA